MPVEPEDSARYWSTSYDRRREPVDDAPRPEPRRPAPEVRSVTQALGSARRYVDALLMAGFGIFCFVAAGSRFASQPTLMVLVGIGAIIYAGYIALSAGSYVMPYLIYGLAVVGVLVFLFSGS